MSLFRAVLLVTEAFYAGYGEARGSFFVTPFFLFLIKGQYRRFVYQCYEFQPFSMWLCTQDDS
jgi:hypothetical protein